MKKDNSKKLLIVGIIGCVLFMIGDYLYAATGKDRTTETIGFMVRVAYLDMATWRMVASILCGFFGTILYYMGFNKMYEFLKIHITKPKDQKWVKLFRVAYISGTVGWAYVHAMFMTVALIFKYVYQSYGDVQTAAEIANKVFYCNAPPMLIAYILCDVGLTVIMITLVWKKIIPLRNTGMRILATLFNPMMCPAIIGNLFTLLPWPLDQVDHGTESLGHALVLVLGLILLNEMKKTGELQDN